MSKPIKPTPIMTDEQFAQFEEKFQASEAKPLSYISVKKGRDLVSRIKLSKRESKRNNE